MRTSKEPAAVGQKSHIMPAKANELYMTKGDCDLEISAIALPACHEWSLNKFLCRCDKGYQTIACMVYAASSAMMHV